MIEAEEVERIPLAREDDIALLTVRWARAREGVKEGLIIIRYSEDISHFEIVLKPEEAMRLSTAIAETIL